MTRNRLSDEYFNWLYNLVSENRYAEHISFRKLLMFLHEVEFTWLISKDQNRAENGIDLRYRFAILEGYENENDIEWVLDVLDGPCSVLEMMVALALRCEEDIMDDPQMGNRTGQWFWNMIVSLGLGPAIDGRFDKRLAEAVVIRFLNRDYEPDGSGGLFTVRHADEDMREIEIWHQLCVYLDSIM